MAGTLRFVSAGAGSGKTYRLTQILHEKLSSGQAAPGGVIATTFTRKAATELRERVRTALLEKGEFALANAMGQARIGTVNSVCGGFLERFAFEAGLAPEQRVLEEAQSGALVREAIDAVSDSATVQDIVELARRDRSRRFMVTSGPSDVDAARAIADKARTRLGPGDASIAHGQFDVGELRALAGRAAVYIGGDSGPLHIAATTQTPVVALFGPTLPERSMPWRDPRWFAEAVDAGPLPCRPCRQRTCAPGDFRCLTRITPEQVAQAAERALDVRDVRAKVINA